MIGSRILAVSLAAFFALGCAGLYTAPVIPAFAPLFTNTQAPLDINFDETEFGSKRGEATVTSVLFFSWGDASTTAAARDGGITTVRGADYKYTNVFFGLYSSFTTVLYGD